MKVLRTLIIFVLILTFQTLGGVTFKVQAPAQVIQGQKFYVEYVINQLPENANVTPTEPNIPNCKCLFEPSMSEQSSYQNINGRSTTNRKVTYTYLFRADAAANVTISSAKINVGGKTLTSKPIKLQILPPDKSVSQRQTNSSSTQVQVQDIDTQTTEKPIGKNDLFIRIGLAKPSVYEQEGVLCTVKLYTKYQISKFQVNVQPTYNGFLAEEIPVSLQGAFERVNGENYYAYVIKQFLLFPQQTGNLTISSGSYDVTAVQYTYINTSLGRMYSPSERTLHVSSNSATLNVKPLPLPKPVDFSGAVGSFKVQRTLLKGQVKTNEASTIQLKIIGTGNLRSITTPAFDFPSQFELYDPQASISATASGNTLSGSVTIDYTFIPQSVGKFNIGSASFVYFDLPSNQYKTIQLDKIPVNVAKGSASKTVKYNNALLKDILPPIKGDLKLVKSVDFVQTQWYTIAFYISLLLIFIVVVIIYRKKIKERANVTLMKRKGANKVANKRLKRARRYMQKEQRDKFYEEMLSALWGYYSDKLTIPVSELNRDNISKELSKFGVDDNVISEIIGIIDECEFSRYAQSTESDMSMSDMYKTACATIEKVENVKHK